MAKKAIPKKQIPEFFDRLARATPDPESELNYVNDYTLLVAVVLSAQSTDAGVNKATESLFERVKTPEAMLGLELEGLKEHIKTIGLYNSKAKNVMKLSRMLVEKHDGKVPGNRADLEALPGVGRKTANVVLNVAFGQPTMAVDTHIFRVSNRTGLAEGKNPREVEDRLLDRVPEKHARDAHHLLILHGRYVCKARKPDCENCIVEDICNYEAKTTAD